MRLGRIVRSHFNAAILAMLTQNKFQMSGFKRSLDDGSLLPIPRQTKTLRAKFATMAPPCGSLVVLPFQSGK